MKLYNYSNDFYSNIEVMAYNNGYEECEAGHDYGPTLRKSYMIHYITEGEGIYQVHQHTYHLKKGDAFLIRPGEPIYYKADDVHPWCYAWIGMQGVKIESYLERTSFAYSPIIHYEDNQNMLSKVYVKMEKAFHSTKSSRDLEINAALYEFLSFLIDAFPNEKQSFIHTDEHYIEEILSYCMNHMDEKIQVQVLAKQIGLDRSYMTRLFKKNMGVSLKEYILSLKIQEAKKMLKETDLPIHIIARSIGMEDALYFSRLFKEKEGLSAKSYRQIHK